MPLATRFGWMGASVDDRAMRPAESPASTPFVWAVGALCRAVADALQARFNPVAVRGEISGFTRAASGHCYFTLKDAQGQLRCAMFRRAASLMEFLPRDGELVDLQGRLGVYEPRGELQLVVESLRRAGVGSLYEQFMQRKARLEAMGLFDAARKRPLPERPHGIGVVTSLGAAALHDVMTALARRVPHIPVIVAPAQVQGAESAASLVRALQALGQRDDLSVILLVRGGGSMEDLWPFNDEALAHAIVASPIPVVSGVGHETDFTLADFCADVRAPTPTAAAELCALPRAEALQELALHARHLAQASTRLLDRHAQRLDRVQSLLARPTQTLGQARLRLQSLQQRLEAGRAQSLVRRQQTLEVNALRLRNAARQHAQRLGQHLSQHALRLSLLDPRLVLQRGYAWLSDAQGQALASVQQLTPSQDVQATLADGVVELRVQGVRPRDIP